MRRNYTQTCAAVIKREAQGGKLILRLLLLHFGLHLLNGRRYFLLDVSNKSSNSPCNLGSLCRVCVVIEKVGEHLPLSLRRLQRLDPARA
jgi:succinate dehydrogenase/fumarate reductase cytochrome b subunit